MKSPDSSLKTRKFLTEQLQNYFNQLFLTAILYRVARGAVCHPPPSAGDDTPITRILNWKCCSHVKAVPNDMENGCLNIP